MNCKRHPSEDSPGVCARCLRDRLLDILAAQHDQPSSPSRHRPRRAVPSEPPRPVSPGDSRHHRRSFFSTPQVGPDAGCTSKASGGFSLLSFIFGHRRSGEEGSGSRFRSIIGGRHRRKKYKTPQMVPETEEARGRASAPCKGLSPAEEESDYETDSGYSTESPGAWRMRTPSPIRRGAVAAHRNNNNKSAVSVFAVCLSPLVRATPSRRRSQTPEIGFSGDLRAGMKPQQHQKDHHRSAAATLAPNRSKKLVDLGRFR